MRYLPWALLALLAYSLVAPLMKVATREIPSDVAAFYANLMLVVAALGVIVVSGQNVTPYATHDLAPAMYAAGACLAVGILAYYRALALGPVSVVAPVFGTFLVVSSLVGIAVLNEALTLRKVLGIALAAVAVWLTAGQ
jgi:transporter family protein